MRAAQEDGIGLITFNQPEKRNAMSIEMWQGWAKSSTNSARIHRSAW